MCAGCQAEDKDVHLRLVCPVFHKTRKRTASRSLWNGQTMNEGAEKPRKYPYPIFLKYSPDIHVQSKLHHMDSPT